MPVNFSRRYKIERPGLRPRLETWICAFVRVSRRSRRKRLKPVKDLPVPPPPGCKRSQRQDHADNGHPRPPSRRKIRFTASQAQENDRRKRHGDQRAVGPQQRRARYRKCESQRATPSGPIAEPAHGPHCQRDSKQRQRFRQRSYCVGSRERTQSSKPQRCQSRPPCKVAILRPHAFCRLARESRQQQTASQFHHNLHASRGKVVFHAEKPETQCQKQRITRQADERAVRDSPVGGQRIPTVQKHVLGNRAVY